MEKQSACPPARRGSGLIFAVVLLFVILGMVITLSSITVLETKMNQKTKSSVGAFYNSESGVEWALNKIATTTASNITGAFGNPSSGVSPTGVTDYKVYLLKADGKVITDGSTLISDIKAVRSVGSQGGETQRAIEAAVASGGGGCYVSYKNDATDAACVAGFKNKGSAGHWGYTRDFGEGIYGLAIVPPGGTSLWGLSVDQGQAYVCCM